MIDPPPRPVSTQDVPILDMSPLVSGGDIGPLAKTLRSACESMAFFYVKNHGVTHATIEGAIAASKRFFEQPLEVRLMHYPLQEQATDSHSIGATAHTDFGLVTVLY